MIHHVAITPGDFNASKQFYTEVMGFPLVAAVKRQAMGGPDAGWTKHVFFDTGGGSLLALWDLHMPAIPAGSYKPGISEGLGLPWWVNHMAFSVDSLEALEARKQHWLKSGMKVSEVDHDFIKSIYTRDPDGNLVEFTVDTRPLDESDRIEAEEIVADDTPATIPDYAGTIFLPDGRVIQAASSS